ncbi:MAG: peptidoglycan editing factor PgeF [Chloroflexi bacterium]|jgi:YfiH family protein|nr:peptidoglycan editing factor PgeF [Chloroflexota bacterium]
MQRIQKNGLAWYELTGPGLALQHAILTRLGGVSAPPFDSLNLGGGLGDDPAAVRENHRRVFAALDIAREQVVSPHQVHGKHVVRVTAAEGGSLIPETDALITDTPGLALMLRFADCTPVLFYDPVQHAAGLAHAGWRGTAAGVAPATVQRMAAEFGSRPADLWAGIGPAIGPAHYAVGSEVVTAIAQSLPTGAQVAERRDGQWYLDLPGAVALQLRSNGIERVARSGLCTFGHTEEWYSHRGEDGRTGRFGVVVMLRERAR